VGDRPGGALGARQTGSMPVSKHHYRLGMRQLAAAVSVVAAGSAPRRNGLTATAVMSLTADPPRLGVSVNRAASAHDVIRDDGCFSVNVLSRQQTGLASVFTGNTGRKGEDRFQGAGWTGLATGAPILEGAAANFDCRVADAVEVGTHTLFVGEVEDLRVDTTDSPLLFMDGAWASLVRASGLELDRYRALVKDSLAAIDGATEAASTPGDGLDRFVRQFALVNMSDVDLTRRFFSHETYAPAEELAEINALKRAFDRKLRDLLADGARAGDFALEDPSVAAMAIVGMMSWMHRWYSDEGRLDRPAIADRFASLVQGMVGLRCEDRHER
jgi:flavin reductase (DIM6/NTAB) family NADH-FMN oxidoreductase RutF